MVEIAGAACVLRRRCRRSHPGRMSKVEKLCHIHLSSITGGQAWQLEPRLHEFKNRGVIRDGVRYEILSCERRDDNQWHPITGVGKVTGGPRCRRANVAGLQVRWQDGVRSNCGLRRHMIIEPSEFVVRKNKYRVFP